ncbi:putative aminoacrylate peracid reductase RutC [Candidatus Entotheonellaceae bacterium PAL068K]
MKHKRIRLFNTRDVYPDQTLDNDMCMVVKAGKRIFMRGQTGLDLRHEMVAAEDAAAQADQAMQNVKVLLEEAGSSLDHICKVTTYITDRAYRLPVYNTVGRHLKGIPTVGTGLIVKGLAMPELKMEIDIEAVIPQAAEHQRWRRFNTRDWFGQATSRDSCTVIRTDDEIYLRGQTGAELDGSRMHGLGRTPEDAAAQANQAMQNATRLLAEAGSSLDEVCKLRVYIGDRAYREPVYQVLGRHFGDVHPCSTGLIMRGFARPDILFEIDMAVALSTGTPHQRFRKFETSQQYQDGQDLRCKFSMAVRAGQRIYLRGQTGSTLDGEFVGYGDAAAQAAQAMQNITTLLGEAGASLNDICKITTYIADRAYREAVYQVVGQHLKGVFPVGTGLIVDGFANPRILVEIDVEAVLQD